MDYKIAVVLNPKINRKLSLLFNESEKEEIFNAIRERCGLIPQENTNMDTTGQLIVLIESEEVTSRQSKTIEEYLFRRSSN